MSIGYLRNVCIKKLAILDQDLGQTICQVLDLCPSKITSIAIRLEPKALADVETTRVITSAKGAQIAGALKSYGLTRRGV